MTAAVEPQQSQTFFSPRAYFTVTVVKAYKHDGVLCGCHAVMLHKGRIHMIAKHLRCVFG